MRVVFEIDGDLLFCLEIGSQLTKLLFGLHKSWFRFVNLTIKLRFSLGEIQLVHSLHKCLEFRLIGMCEFLQFLLSLVIAKH